MSNKTLYLIDSGHGGVAFGEYLTAGKRSPEVPPGIYEGEFNRKLGLSICSFSNMIDGLRDRVIHLNPGPVNVPESVKIKYANALYKKLGKPPTVYIALHANAARGWGWNEDAHGMTIFHARFSKVGPIVARIFSEELCKLAQVGSCFNADSISYRGIIPKNFYVLWRTAMPAILIENGFMTNHNDAETLADQHYVWELAERYVNAMEAIDEI